MDAKRMTVGVIGCGKISQVYLKNMTEVYPNLRVVACSATTRERAMARAEQFGIEARTVQEILEDPAIEMVVVLTPAPTHYDLIRQALEAGKHVYTEKTMTVETAQAEELVQLADRKGLYLGSAPDTFLGAAWQKAKQVIDQGLLGEITGFDVCVNRNLDRLTSFYSFLRLPGGGICYDYGVYHLTALVSLLGPVEEVCAVVENRKPVRVNVAEGTEEYGKPFPYPNEGQVTAIVRTESGITGSFALNGESIRQDLAHFRIYGTEGVLELPDPNGFCGEVVLIRSKNDRQMLENDLPYEENSRGIGPAEMARAIREGRPNRASKEMALHVLDTIECMMASGRKKAFVRVRSTCNVPPALKGSDRAEIYPKLP